MQHERTQKPPTHSQAYAHQPMVANWFATNEPPHHRGAVKPTALPTIEMLVPTSEAPAGKTQTPKRLHTRPTPGWHPEIDR